MNIYRGCTHGCIYCDSRSKCYQFTHDFDDVEVKQNAPELLEEALRNKRKQCMIGTGAMCDPYIPAEKELCLMRRCLEIIEKYSFGATLQTKSDLVLRDLDVLERINRKTKAVVQMTLTTADDALCRLVEPCVCPTSRRFEVLCECRARGIPTVVWFSPLLPFINDTVENVDGIVDYCVRAGVKAIICFGMGLTLREGNREYFYAALDKLAARASGVVGGLGASDVPQKNGVSGAGGDGSVFAVRPGEPSMKQRYVKTFGYSYIVSSPREKELMAHLEERCRAHGIMLGTDNVFKWMEDFPEPVSPQMELF